MSELTISIISIGDELLKGKIVNKNLSIIDSELLKLGIYPSFQATVKDQGSDIKNILSYCTEISNIIIMTGGLGPTTDDITVATIADFFKLELSLNDKALDNLKEFLKKRKKYTISKNNLKQAYIPEGSEIIKNNNGTAPGIILKRNNKTIYLLPGPPHELIPMLQSSVIPYVKKKISTKKYYETIYAIGIPESDFQKTVSDILGDKYNSFNISFRANPGICELMILGENKSKVSNAADKIRERIKNSILSDGFSHPAEELADIFNKKSWTLSTAESCTGGLIASKLTDYPGASSYFKGSCIVYSNDSKENLLNVSSNTLNVYGAVSAETAEEMAKGLCKKLNTNAGIAVTGIAGPEGGTKEKPVGLVYIAVKFLDKVSVKKYNFTGSRNIIRQRIVITALHDLIKIAGQ